MNFEKIGSVTRSIIEKIKNSKSKYLGICFALPLVLMLVLYIVVIELHPFGDGSVLVLDMNGQYVYYFEAFREAIVGEGSFVYSFSRALGGEFWGIFFYYLASPLSFIVILFPKEMILEALLTIILLKTGLCGLTFGFYLHKHTESKRRIATIIFSTIYALSSYAIVYQCNTMWIDALIWLPIITYAIEELIKKKRFVLYVVSLAVTIMSNYYIGYMVCIYSALYFVYYCLANKHGSINLLGEDNHLLKSFVRFALYSVLAAAMAAFVLVAAYYSLSFGKSDFSNPSFAFNIKFNPIKMLTKLLSGAYDTVRPEGLPYIYCGIVSLFLLPIYFSVKKIGLREKIASAIFILVFVLSFMINPIDLIWHGFQKPNWLNYRYSFMLVFFFLVLAYKAYMHFSRKNARGLIISGIFILAFILIARNFELKSYVTSDSALLEKGAILVSLIAATVIFTLLFLIAIFKSDKAKRVSEVILAVVICGELLCNGAVLMRQYDSDVLYSKYSSYNNYIQDLRPSVEAIKALDSGFYRTEKTEHRKYNDNLALGIYGISNSTSTLNADAIELLGNMGYVARSHYSHHKGENPVGSSLLGIKYLISKKSKSKIASTNIISQRYNLVYSNNTHDVYRNPYALSLAYGVDGDIFNYDKDAYDTSFETLNAIVGYMLGSDSTPEIFTPVWDYSVKSSQCSKSKTDLSTVYVPKDKESGGTIFFKFTATKDGEYFFHPQTEYTTEVKLHINKASYGTYLGSKNDNLVSLGYYEAGDKIEIQLNTKKSLYLIKNVCPIWYFDNDEFTAAFESLSSNPQLVIDEGHSSTKLSGSITTTKEDQTVLMTLPYDEGWKIYVDGEKVETERCLNALMSFEIDNVGEHTVVMKYSPDIYKVGIAVSLVGFAVFALLLFLKLRKNETSTIAEEIMWDTESDENPDDNEAEIGDTENSEQTENHGEIESNNDQTVQTNNGGN